MAVSPPNYGTAVYAASGTVTPPLPASAQANDILVILCSVYGASTLACSDGAYAKVADYANGSAHVVLFWKRHTGTEAAPDITGAADSVSARIMSYRGANPSGSPWHSGSFASSGSGSDTTAEAPAFTTSVDGAFAIIVGASSDANNWSPAGASYGNLDAATGASYQDTALGSNTSAFNMYGRKTTAGALGSIVATQSSLGPDPWVATIGALVPGAAFNVAVTAVGPDELPPAVIPPPTSYKQARPVVSLMVGSDDLGWQELGEVAVLGQMTKAMPGGDGSLEFSLYGDDAWKARNVLIPGASLVRLVIDGEAAYGGFIASDPLRHRVNAQGVVDVACSGPYGFAARDGRYGYIGIDTDLEQWRRSHWSTDNVHPGRFTVRTDGQFEFRADSDRTYAPGDQTSLSYAIFDRLLSAHFIAGMDFEYQCRLPSSAWHTSIWQGEVEYWYVDGTATVNTWTAQSLDFGEDQHIQELVLFFTCSGSGSPSNDAWLKLRKVHILGRWSNVGHTTADRALTLADILVDLAAAVGVTDVRMDAALSGFTVDEFVSRYPTDVAETLRAACALYTDSVEVFFDLDPATLALRFTGRPRPADTALAPENRLWVVGGRGGEDASGLERDWEVTADQITVLYACKDDAGGLPDGTVKAVTYPGGTEPAFPCADVVDLTQDKGAMTLQSATNYATAIYQYQHSNRYTGEVVLEETAHTERGKDEPTWRLRPGDRLTALDRDDTDRFGETLYVQETAYDFQSGKATATVGMPFDPVETAWTGQLGVPGRGPMGRGGTKSKGGYHVRTGVA